MHEIKTHVDNATGDYIIMIKMDSRDLHHDLGRALDAAVQMAAEKIAERIVEQLGPDIMTKLDATAIANMAIAEAGAAVNRTLKEKLPDKIIEVDQSGTRPVILQRGFFGGLKRLT